MPVITLKPQALVHLDLLHLVFSHSPKKMQFKSFQNVKFNDWISSSQAVVKNETKKTILNIQDRENVCFHLRLY